MDRSLQGAHVCFNSRLQLCNSFLSVFFFLFSVLMVQLLFVTLTVPEDCDNLAAVNILCVSLRQNLPCAAFV